MGLVYWFNVWTTYSNGSKWFWDLSYLRSWTKLLYRRSDRSNWSGISIIEEDVLLYWMVKIEVWDEMDGCCKLGMLRCTVVWCTRCTQQCPNSSCPRVRTTSPRRLTRKVHVYSITAVHVCLSETALLIRNVRIRALPYDFYCPLKIFFLFIIILKLR